MRRGLVGFVLGVAVGVAAALMIGRGVPAPAEGHVKACQMLVLFAPPGYATTSKECASVLEKEVRKALTP